MADVTAEQGAAEKQAFPRTFYYANGIELLERLAHYGVYVGLALYLSNVVKMSDVQVGWVLGNFRFVGSMAPIPCGSIADRIGFKRPCQPLADPVVRGGVMFQVRRHCASPGG